ncbi:MetQ/NlpA family ABC transporter substrate-binding protein [Labrys sp. ZIDIC5]|uniref:MetQ/NlpA family ABC transporter substrate-binding protein n=1 Tax=Labrys sedimenti TaxID=3106036 RepID=UPI002ACABB74|nr:MetQ/NlpA family ABC transporter substrate-binding protein [Labrys sp. ZIDIC5]MDZ5453951.1 MetQ/NlpA family ABC transporter substrate-binding protein [Labrys sp. ZIDIC5]
MPSSLTRRSVLALAAASLFAAPAAALASSTRIRIGATPGPMAETLEAAKPVAAKLGLDIEVIEFSDYVVPNAALDAGEIEANAFQNQPYLDNQIADRGYKIVGIAPIINSRLGVYSRRHKAWSEVPDGATIAIQNDPTNGGRTLLLLRDKGVISLRDGVGYKPIVADITANPKQLHFLEVDAAQTPRSLDDVDAAAVNANYAVTAGLDPTKQALILEELKPQYTNLIAVRTTDKDKPWVPLLAQSYRSPEVRDFVLAKYKGAYVPTW